MTAAAARFRDLYDRAHAAGLAAAGVTRPTPMVVSERVNPLDDASPVKNAWFVPSGVCGFAGIRLRPATSAFARWLKSAHGWRRSYYGGLENSVFEFGQSMELKEAYSTAFAAVLKDAGYHAYAWSRMD